MTEQQTARTPGIMFTETNAAEVQAFIGDAGEAHNGPGYVRIGEQYGVAGDWIIRGEVGGVVRFSIQHPASGRQPREGGAA